MPLKMGLKMRIRNSFIIISILMKNQKVHVNETFKTSAQSKLSRPYKNCKKIMDLI